VQHSVAVVEPRQYEAARQGERQFRRQQMADVSDDISVERDVTGVSSLSLGLVVT